MPASLNVPPPPARTEHDQIQAAQARLRAKNRFSFFHPKKSAPSQKPAPTDVSTIALPLTLAPIDLHPSTASSDDENEEHYRWAVVYENQRGLKVFSTPYYSFFSLLPTDPSPFTVPNASPRRSKQPDVSLDSYPLPDGSWRWQSPWMVDMSRSDSGEVAHDGFEYNFMFRTHSWHASAGPLSWVRRRRWLRLMMRPVRRKDPKLLAESPGMNTPITPADSVLNGVTRHRHSLAYSLQPPSVLESNPEEESFLDYSKHAWLSTDPEENWAIYRGAIRSAGTDGRLLELWSQWLAYDPGPLDGRGKRKQWTEDEDPPFPEEPISSAPSQASPPAKENIIIALRTHGEDILTSFIFPESRTRFLKILESTGLASELKPGFSPRELDFWSYLGSEKRVIPEESTLKKLDQQ